MSHTSSPPTRSRVGIIAIRFLEATASLAVLAILVHVIANVFMRMAFGQPLMGTNEMVGNWYLPIIAFIGFVVAKTRSEHIEATLIYDRISEKNKLIWSIVANAVSVVALAVFTFYTLDEAMHATKISMTVGVSGITVWPVFWIVPFGFGVLTVMFAVDVVNNIRLRRPATGEQPLH